MEMDNWIAAILMVALLLVGIFSGSALFPREKTIEVEVLGECEECQECEVCETCEETIVEVPAQSLLDLAVEDFMKAVEDEEVYKIVDDKEEDVNLLEVGDHEYDFDEISISKVYDDYTIDYDGDENTVTFDIKLKYDEDDEESEKVKYQISVYYEEDEDTTVELL